jgi:hypothetical protein
MRRCFGVIEIVYPSGCMTIILRQFFPTTQRDVKKLLKVIDMDPNGDKHRQAIKSWLEEEIRRCDGNAAKRKEQLQKNLVMLS